MSRVDVATEAQKPENFDPTSIRTLSEPLLDSVQIGVQPGVLPSRERIARHPSSRRSHPDTVFLCFLRQVQPEHSGGYIPKNLSTINSYAKLAFVLAG